MMDQVNNTNEGPYVAPLSQEELKELTAIEMIKAQESVIITMAGKLEKQRKKLAKAEKAIAENGAEIERIQAEAAAYRRALENLWEDIGGSRIYYSALDNSTAGASILKRLRAAEAVVEVSREIPHKLYAGGTLEQKLVMAALNKAISEYDYARDEWNV